MKKLLIPFIAVLLAAAGLMTSCTDVGGVPGFQETTIAELIDRMTPTKEPAGGYYVDAVVVTDVSSGSNYTNRNLAVMTKGATTPGNGLILYGIDFRDLGLAPGDEIRVMLGNSHIQKFRGSRANVNDPYVYEIIISDPTAILKKGTNVPLTPVTIRYDEIADYQGMYVRIDNVQSVDGTVGMIWKSGTTKFMPTGLPQTFDVYVNSTATGIVGRQFKSGSGSITGVAAVYGGSSSARSAAQLMPRHYSEVTDLDGGRIVDTYSLNISPNTNQTVAAGVTSLNFTVTSNTDWACYLDGVPRGTGSGNGTSTVSFPANTSVTDPVVMEVKFTTVGLGNNIVRTVTVTQQPDVPYFTVTPDTDQSVLAETTSFDFDVATNSAWECFVNGVQQDSGTGDKTVSVTFPENTDTAGPATIPVSFSTVGLTPEIVYEISITQAAAIDPSVKTLEVSPNTTQEVAATVSSLDFTVESNVEWKAYLNGVELGGHTGSKIQTVHFGANGNPENRTHSVSFISQDPGLPKTISVLIVQAGAVATVTHTETFGGFTSTNNSYTAPAATGTYTSGEVPGVVWSYAGTAHNQNGVKFTIGRWQPTGTNKNPGSLTSNTISGGIGSLSIDWKNAFNDGAAGYDGGNSFKVLINGNQVGVFDNNVSPAGTEGTYTIDNINVSGDFVLKIESNERGRPGVNRISWTTY